MLRSPVDNIIIQLDKAYQDEISFESGVKLFISTEFNPQWHTTVTGKVIGSPLRLSKKHELKGLSIEVEEGDEIIFSYMVIEDAETTSDNRKIHHNVFYHNGQYYWKCEYFHYLGKIVNGKIVPAQGYVFLEKVDKEELKSSFLILPEMTQKEKQKGVGRVIGIGKNKSHEPKLSISEGDTVRFPDRYACTYEIKGKEYVVLPQDLIMAQQ